MALPGRDQTFAYENCREMLNKLKREIERYCAVAGVVELLEGETLLRHVDQLKDSALNDLTPEQRQTLNLESLDELQCRARKQCRALYLCRHVATASKHWSVKKHPDPTIKAVVECSEAGWAGYFFDGSTKTPANQV
jgi:hypothetical protein